MDNLIQNEFDHFNEKFTQLPEDVQKSFEKVQEAYDNCFQFE